jgi:two-component system nitrate/nitrite response regulator NarL
MTRIVLCSDEPILAKGLESALRKVEGLELLPSCRTLAGLITQMAVVPPNLILLDHTGEVTFSALSQLRRAIAECKIVLWVNSISTELAFQAMGLGVRGILRKSLPTELQVKCLQEVGAGELWFEKALTDRFSSERRVVLTASESQLLDLVTSGLKNKEIGALLGIDEGNVKVYLSRLFEKVGVKDRFELALFGLKNTTADQFQAAVSAAGQRVAIARGRSSGVTVLPAGPARRCPC